MLTVDGEKIDWPFSNVTSCSLTKAEIELLLTGDEVDRALMATKMTRTQFSALFPTRSLQCRSWGTWHARRSAGKNLATQSDAVKKAARRLSRSRLMLYFMGKGWKTFSALPESEKILRLIRERLGFDDENV